MLSWQERRRTPEQWMDAALHAERADERRKAVDVLSRGRHAADDWVAQGFSTIARTDSDPMVRVSALRGLRASGGPAAVSTALKLLQRTPPPDVVPPPAPVRWQAMQLLRDLCHDQRIGDSERDGVVATLIDRTDLDADRNVRLAAIEALAVFRERRVLIALIDVLRERDFALQAAAEQSLAELTGQHFEYDADAWSAWLNRTTDLFTSEEPPAAQRVPGSSEWWSRLWGGKR